MDAINWDKYKSDDFQLFCNALLSFEIGKSYRPFTAPGRDTGIDGLFEGTYEGKEGKWRFQDKFHKTARKNAVASLKNDLKKEIANIRDEQMFILLTNVDLLPQEYTELLELYEQHKPQNKEVVFDVWHGAKLFTLSLRYPLLWLWLDEGFKTSQLLGYKTAFAKELSNPITEAFTFNNQFEFRDDKLRQLTEFLNSKSKVTLITGEAGIGKTRLVLEFFKQLDTTDDEHICLVLTNKNIAFDKLTRALSGPKEILLLVDDAHEYDPKAIDDLNTLVANPSLSVKLLLTAREIQSYNSIRLIKEYEQQKINRIRLSELTREETRKLLAVELKGHYLSNFLTELTTITHGKPILIVSVLRAAANNMRIDHIKNDDFLNSYVRNYFSSLLEQIVADTAISKIKSGKLLQLICLLEPFAYSDVELAKKIAGYFKIETEAVTHAFQLLINGSFVSGRYEQSIKPDYYSDIILKNADKTFIEQVLQQFPNSTQNIIANLASADEIGEDKQSMLPSILDRYVEPIKTGGDSITISRILETVHTISYFKPELARKVLETYITALQQKESALYKNFVGDSRYDLTGGNSDRQKITSLLSQLLYQEQYFEFVYQSVFMLYEVLQEAKPLAAVFHYSKRDYIEHYKVARQLFFVRAFQQKTSSLRKDQLLFGIACLKTFLIHDFTASSLEGTGKDSITITTYYIPANAKVKKLRKEIIEILMSIFRSSEDEEVKNIALETLLDVPRGIFATERNPTPYKGDDELRLILEFLKIEARGIPQSSQKEILDKLHWYTVWKINEEFLPIIKEIRKLLTPRNLTEEIIQLFVRSEHGIDFHKAEETIKEKINTIYEKNSAQAIAESLSAIFLSYGNKLYNFHLAISVLANDHPTLAKEVYSLLWTQNRQFIYQWGSVLLNAIYFKHKDVLFYWEEIQRLQKEQSVEADNLILWNYGTHHASKMDMNEEDFKAIEQIAVKNNPLNYFNLTRPLVVFVVQKPERGKKLCMDFLNQCHYQEADNFFLFLSDNVDESYEQVKYLALNGTIRFALSYNMEKCLNEVLKRGENDLIYDYLITRIEYNRQFVLRNESLIGYELVPDGSHAHLFEGIEDVVKLDLYRKLMNWYCQAELHTLEVYLLKEIFQCFNSIKYISEPFNVLFKETIEMFKDNKVGLMRILEILETYNDKNEELLKLVEEIYVLASNLSSGDTEYIEDLNFKAYQTLTELGVKSGPSGMPFQVDVDLKELLVRYADRMAPGALFSPVLKRAINSVERDIDRSFDKDNETW